MPWTFEVDYESGWEVFPYFIGAAGCILPSLVWAIAMLTSAFSGDMSWTSLLLGLAPLFLGVLAARRVTLGGLGVLAIGAISLGFTLITGRPDSGLFVPLLAGTYLLGGAIITVVGVAQFLGRRFRQ